MYAGIIDWSQAVIEAKEVSVQLDGIDFSLTLSSVTDSELDPLSMDAGSLRVGQVDVNEMARAVIAITFSQFVEDLQIPIWHIQKSEILDERLRDFSVAPSSIFLGNQWAWDGTTVLATGSEATPEDGGVLSFDGPLTSLTFEYSKSETWPNSSIRIGNISFQIPEPSSYALTLCALACLYAAHRRSPNVLTFR